MHPNTRDYQVPKEQSLDNPLIGIRYTTFGFNFIFKTDKTQDMVPVPAIVNQIGLCLAQTDYGQKLNGLTIKTKDDSVYGTNKLVFGK
jgi:hypothetical protein